MKVGEKKIVKVRKGDSDVGYIMLGHHMIFGDKTKQNYDYIESEGTITLFKAPFTVDEGAITIL